ncbi:Uncharacterized conserved protein [Streptococcus agalactiae]|nr:Uncharacterized conserved protein [Streptococcus agalactiae]
MKKLITEKKVNNVSTANYLKLGLVSAMFAGGAFVALGSTQGVSASTFTAPQATPPKAERQLTDSEIYERAQKQVLPKYIQGSLSGILNQHSTLYKQQNAAVTPQVSSPKAERQLTDSEIYERAQKQVLPKYIQGSLSGILNQHSTLYKQQNAAVTPQVSSPKAERQLTDSELYEGAQKQILPKYIQGSLSGILNQHSTLYKQQNAAVTPQVSSPKAERQLTDSEIYERAQKQVLPKYIQGSLSGILNQHSTLYKQQNAAVTPQVSSPKAERQLTDSEIYERAQKQVLPKYIQGSLSGILNQHSTLYKQQNAAVTPQVSSPKAERQLTDSEIYERAQKQVLPKYIQGSLSGILNQHSTLNV